MVAKSAYTPERGDVVWVTFDPVVGHEQKGRRPALILTPSSYNRTVGMAIACPITSKVKGYPFEVPVTFPEGGGVILTDQIRAVDWKARAAEKVARVSPATLLEVTSLLSSLLGLTAHTAK